MDRMMSMASSFPSDESSSPQQHHPPLHHRHPLPTPPPSTRNGTPNPTITSLSHHHPSLSMDATPTYFDLSCTSMSPAASTSSPSSSSTQCDAPMVPHPCCSGCNHPIRDPFILKAQDETWHPECLTCSGCHRSLDGESSCFRHKGGFYCKRDFMSMMVQQSSIPPPDRCGRCEDFISDLVIRTDVSTFHVSCFTCSFCGVQLRKGDLFSQRGRHVFCSDHSIKMEEEDNPTSPASMYHLHHPHPHINLIREGDHPDSNNNSNLSMSLQEESDGLPLVTRKKRGPKPGSVKKERKPRTKKGIQTSVPTSVPSTDQLEIEISTSMSPSSSGTNTTTTTTTTNSIVTSICSDSSTSHPPPPPNNPMQLHHQHHHLFPSSFSLSSISPSSSHDSCSLSPSGSGKTSTSRDHQSGRTKRMRTSFKHHQLKKMKSYFSINHNPDSKDLKGLSLETGLSKRVLQVWFQNARAKWRRSVLRQQSVGPHLVEEGKPLSEMDPHNGCGDFTDGSFNPSNPMQQLHHHHHHPSSRTPQPLDGPSSPSPCLFPGSATPSTHHPHDQSPYFPSPSSPLPAMESITTEPNFPIFNMMHMRSLPMF